MFILSVLKDLSIHLVLHTLQNPDPPPIGEHKPVPVSVTGVWWARVLLHQRNHNLFRHVRQQGERRVHDKVDETYGGKKKQSNLRVMLFAAK